MSTNFDVIINGKMSTEIVCGVDSSAAVPHACKTRQTNFDTSNFTGNNILSTRWVPVGKKKRMKKRERERERERKRETERKYKSEAIDVVRNCTAAAAAAAAAQSTTD